MLEKLVICTTGTSIGKKSELLQKATKEGYPWDHESVPKLKQDIRNNLKDLDLSQDDNQRKCSAEMNSLSRLKLGKTDRVVLLVTDTADGQATAEVLKESIVKAYGLSDSQVDLKRVEGLQVRNASELREKGLRNFVGTVLHYLEDDQMRHQYDIILNPTGGFKGVVPFLTILGMLYRRRSVYIFEHANELIDLPPLPFSFDLQLYERAKEALQYIDKETSIHQELFFQKIDNYSSEERDLFLSFTEPLDNNGNITLSPLAFCLLKIESGGNHPPKVRKQVCELLKKGHGESWRILKDMLANCGSPLWRNNHYHTWDKNITDMAILKRSASPERLAGYLHEGVFYVTHAFNTHDDYEKGLKGAFKKDYAPNPNDFIDWKP